MDNLTLTPEVIDYAKKEVDVSQYYDRSESATPKHVLFKEFTEKTKWKGLPKIIYYILMDELFQVKKSENGDLGYCVTLKTEFNERNIHS